MSNTGGVGGKYAGKVRAPEFPAGMEWLNVRRLLRDGELEQTMNYLANVPAKINQGS